MPLQYRKQHDASSHLVDAAAKGGGSPSILPPALTQVSCNGRQAIGGTEQGEGNTWGVSGPGRVWNRGERGSSIGMLQDSVPILSPSLWFCASKMAGTDLRRSIGAVEAYSNICCLTLRGLWACQPTGCNTHSIGTAILAWGFSLDWVVHRFYL